VGIDSDSESESVDGLPGSSVFVTVSRGSGGTGGGLCEASIGGGGGAKGGNFNEIGTLRTCRKMAEAYAGQMARINSTVSFFTEDTKQNTWNG